MHTIQEEMAWLKEAKEWAEACFAIFNLYDLAAEVSISFNDRFTRRLASANYHKRSIRLSTPLWERATPKERYETVVHEVCHIVCDSTGPGVSAHGWQWKKAMVVCGVAPERCHSIDRTGLKRTTKVYTSTCRCPGEGQNARIIKITLNMAKKIRAGIRYSCRTCKGIRFLLEEPGYLDGKPASGSVSLHL